MATIKIEGFVVARKNWDEKFEYTWAAVELKEHGYITVKPQVLEFELPSDFNPTAAMIESLAAEKQKIQAAFSAKIAEINDKISNLQALTFNPTEAVCTDS